MTIPRSIVGLVGPNGCGKSNIIDAVRWVMGESAAGHLRGSSMEDVIFNGSSKRKPVNQASVELIFENNEGRVTGPWSEYREISIRRTVERGSGSTYYINGTKCRRRDVMDIFLGTGLGPRSYSIIEQGMISRVIDAKPEELRTFIEEAAGVSRYKERRRETENRIRHTEENLTRLADLMQEVQKQADKAARQAKAAERFRALRQQERSYRQAVYVMNHTAYDEVAKALELQRLEQDKFIKAQQMQQRQQEAKLLSAKTEDMSQKQAYEAAQKQYYEYKANVEKIQQKIEFIRSAQKKANEQAAALAEEHDRLTKAHEESVALQAQRGSDMQSLTQQLAESEAKLEALEGEREQSRETLQSVEAALKSQQQSLNALERDDSLMALQQQQIAKEITRQQRAHQQLIDEQQALKSILAEANQETDLDDLEALRARVASVEQDLETTEQRYQDARESVKLARQQRDQESSRLNTAKGKLDALRTLQRNQLQQEDAKKNRKIPSLYKDAPHLTETLEVAAGWEQAVEVILSDWLSARVIGQYPDIDSSQYLLDAGLGVVVDSKTHASDFAITHRLSEKLKQAPAAIMALLQHVYVADDLTAALDRLDDLAAHESVITPDGYWLSPMGIRPTAEQQSIEHSLIYRQRVIAELEAETATLTQSRVQLDQTLQAATRQQDDAERELAELKRQNTAEQSKLSKQLAEHAAKTQQQSERESRLGIIQDKIDAAAQSAETAQMQALEADEKRHAISEELEAMRAKLPDLDQTKIDADVAFTEIDRQYTQLNQEAQQQQLRHARLDSELSALAARLKDLEERAEKTKRQQQASMAANELAEIDELEIKLNQAQAAMAEQETQVNSLREKLEAHQNSMQTLESEVSELRELISEKEQIRQQTVVEISENKQQAQYQASRLSELNISLRDAKNTLDQLNEARDKALELSEAEAEADKLKHKIEQMGAVNLQAIEEHKSLAERVAYLREQSEDLHSALDTLKSAINAIDEETKARFQETFTAVNEQVKTLFPQLFGGGKAYLELTDDDMLTAGIRIVARPPGKMPASIQLLSGGEKALTAAALVFGIFQLNPSPFCMLDEVDAPLDDANVGRFCKLVQSLSDRVQFIIVTHNKVTMEMAEQLSGVTMGEPGVSRLVQVNIDDAVAMVG